MTMAANSSNSLKRPADTEWPMHRKVRKGTQSCWECKRRKVRCTFAAPENSICESCEQRKTLCVSQELPDPGRTSQTDDRIDRVERLLEEVLRQLPEQSATRQESRRSAGLEHHVHSPSSAPVDDCQRLRGATAGPTSGRGNREVEALSSSCTEYNYLSRNLQAAFPTQEDLEAISREHFEVPSCLLDLPCVQPFKQSGVSSPVRDLTAVPSDPHPLAVAKNLLILGSYLQSLSRSAMERLALLGIDHQDMASRAVQTVRQRVLVNEKMVRSLDGIECLAMESMFCNNAGRLRDAWLILRAAISIARLLGLDRRAFRPPSQVGPRFPGDIKEEAIWFHLLSSDRYLSLMLGLPQAAPNCNNFATPEALAPYTPLQRLERTHCLAGGIMLRHADRRDGNTSFVEEVDVLLREAAENLEPQWWLVPDFSNRNEPASAESTLRLMVQFTHFHILARLHLPYLLHSPTDGRLDHHKLTTINASREILVRYMALRTSDLNNYCHGVDFLMFIAATTLCIAHINSSHWRRYAEQGSHFDFLGHQRPSDRGLMEQALNTLKISGRSSNDEIEDKISAILQHLLNSEINAAAGATFTITTSTVDDVSEFAGEQEDDGKSLKITISHVGTIRIEKDHVSASRSAEPFFGGEVGARSSGVNAATYPPSEDVFQGAQLFDQGYTAQNWSLQGVDVALFNDLCQDWDADGFAL